MDVEIPQDTQIHAHTDTFLSLQLMMRLKAGLSVALLGTKHTLHNAPKTEKRIAHALLCAVAGAALGAAAGKVLEPNMPPTASNTSEAPPASRDVGGPPARDDEGSRDKERDTAGPTRPLVGPGGDENTVGPTNARD